MATKDGKTEYNPQQRITRRYIYYYLLVIAFINIYHSLIITPIA